MIHYFHSNQISYGNICNVLELKYIQKSNIPKGFLLSQTSWIRMVVDGGYLKNHAVQLWNQPQVILVIKEWSLEKVWPFLEISKFNKAWLTLDGPFIFVVGLQQPFLCFM